MIQTILKVSFFMSGISWIILNIYYFFGPFFLKINFTSDLYNLFNTIFFSMVISYFFYWLTVLIPERRTRTRIKNFYRRSYRDFKLRVISILIQASGEPRASSSEELLDVQKFRAYFEEKWLAVANGLEKNPLLLSGIIEALEMLKEETYFTIDKLDLNDQVFEFLKNTSQLISHYKNIKKGTDDLKFSMGFLWQIFAAWSSAEGFHTQDFMEEILEKF